MPEVAVRLWPQAWPSVRGSVRVLLSSKGIHAQFPAETTFETFFPLLSRPAHTGRSLLGSTHARQQQNASFYNREGRAESWMLIGTDTAWAAEIPQRCSPAARTGRC